MPIVQAAMTASVVRGDVRLSQELETAMVQAVTDALAEGVSVTNSSELIRRKMRARGLVLRKYGRPIPDEVTASE